MLCHQNDGDDAYKSTAHPVMQTHTHTPHDVGDVIKVRWIQQRTITNYFSVENFCHTICVRLVVTWTIICIFSNRFNDVNDLRTYRYNVDVRASGVWLKRKHMTKHIIFQLEKLTVIVRRKASTFHVLLHHIQLNYKFMKLFTMNHDTYGSIQAASAVPSKCTPYRRTVRQII